MQTRAADQEEPKWRVAWHGKPSTQQRNDANEGNGSTAASSFLITSTSVSESRATERGPRSQAVQTAKVGAERRREKRKEMRNLRRARIPVTAAALGTWADRHFSVLIHDDLVPAFFFFLEDIPSVRWPCACTHLLFSGDHEQQQLFQSRPVATLDGSKVGAVPGRDGTTPQRQPHPPRERPTNVLRMMQDHLQQTTVISHGRSQKTLAEQLHHRQRTKLPMRPWIHPLKHVDGKQRQGACTSKNKRPWKTKKHSGT